MKKTKDYTKGKANPFSTYQPISGSSNGEVGTNDENSVTNTNTSTGGGNSGTFYKNTGTK